MTTSRIRPLSDDDFDATISQSNVPVLVDFTATWCRPCKLQAAVLEGLAASNDQVLITSVDVDAHPELAARFGVRGMPTLLVFEHGKETARRLGLANERTLETLLAKPSTSTRPAAAERVA